MNNKQNKFRWINESIVIDFELTTYQKDLIQEMERCDLEGNYLFFEYADVLDINCKLLYSNGLITKKQWQLLNWKYPFNEDLVTF